MKISFLVIENETYRRKWLFIYIFALIKLFISNLLAFNKFDSNLDKL
jgi:hypothetical protein